MYYMAYFKDEEQKLFLAQSGDLMNWKLLCDGKAVFSAKEQGKLIRDPYLIKHKDGKWHLFFTNQWFGTTIGHSVSDDLQEWSRAEELCLFPGNEDVHNCWAPECFWEEKEQCYYLIWSTSFVSQNSEHEESNRIWYAVSRDLTRFSRPEKLFDPGYPVIDATVTAHKGIYYMAFKDEREFNRPESPYSAIRTATAEDMKGPYGQISPILTGWRTEGPMLLHQDETFYIFYDAFGEGQYRGMKSTDFIHWTDVTQDMNFPEGCKHLCIVEDK